MAFTADEVHYFDTKACDRSGFALHPAQRCLVLA
jgi:hypothetical protein